jgi:hypothetical protein
MKEVADLKHLLHVGRATSRVQGGSRLDGGHPATGASAEPRASRASPAWQDRHGSRGPPVSRESPESHGPPWSHHGGRDGHDARDWPRCSKRRTCREMIHGRRTMRAKLRIRRGRRMRPNCPALRLPHYRHRHRVHRPRTPSSRPEGR